MTPEMKSLVEDLQPVLLRHNATIVVRASTERTATLAINTASGDHYLEFDEEINGYDLRDGGAGAVYFEYVPIAKDQPPKVG
jgi:hypothetical protein